MRRIVIQGVRLKMGKIVKVFYDYGRIQRITGKSDELISLNMLVMCLE